DHMTDLELIFTMLGEKATTAIAQANDAKGFPQNKTAAQKGGKIAGNARKNLELETKKNVVTSENYLTVPEKIKKVEKK
ncbi:MAG: phage antirepressor protein, partial [Nanoarchaeota archaeon]